MKKLLVLSIVMVGCLQAAFAQDGSDVKNEIREQRIELMKERQIRSGGQFNKVISAPDLSTGKSMGLAAVTAADVGDPDSFGRNAQFLGFASAGFILIDPTCDPADIGVLGPDDRCITVPDPSVPVPTTTFNDIGRITIPGKSVDNIIYAIANHTLSFDVNNTTAGPTQARLSYSPSITIESVALNDPSLIDPNTGLPFNGSFTTTGFGTHLFNKTLAPGALEVVTDSYTRANTAGFSRVFFQALGLPNNVINQLYKKPMTIRLNVRVSSRWVEFATIGYSIRFLGN
ncbi:MAG: hypothetical protein ABI878_01075 [Acidobacteriota bacterium]